MTYNLKNALNRCGKTVFVKYIPNFINNKPHNKIKDYISESYANDGTCSTKYNTVKNIYEKGLTIQALENIIKSSKVPYTVRQQAQDILSTL